MERIRDATTETIDAELLALKQVTSSAALDLKAAQVVLDSLKKTFAPRQESFQDTHLDLLQSIENCLDPGMVVQLSQLFSRVTPASRVQIIRHLSRIDTPQAVGAVFLLLKTRLPEEELPLLSLPGWSQDNLQATRVLPELLDLLDHENYRDEVLYVTLSYLQNKKIKPERLKDLQTKLIGLYKNYMEALAAVTPATDKKNWYYDGAYLAIRERPAILLDIFGYLTGSAIDSLLETALRGEDPRLVHFAALSLIMKGFSVPALRLQFIAQDPEMRRWLFAALSDFGKLDLFPGDAITQEKLAESDLVNWLIYPTELGVAPDEISLEKVVSIDTESNDGIIEYFVFKYRTLPPHSAAPDGWMAGVSGPFIKHAYPTVESHGDTFSNFEPWGSKTADEHLDAILETLRNYRENK